MTNYTFSEKQMAIKARFGKRTYCPIVGQAFSLQFFNAICKVHSSVKNILRDSPKNNRIPQHDIVF